jgi:SAM-dependent methyltransferase
VLELPWPDGHFDVVVDGNLLHCIVLDDRARVLAEARRVLRPGGALIVMCMAGDPPPSAQLTFDPETRCGIRDGVAGRHFATPEGLLAELTAAGFEIASQWLNPATNDTECDELVVAARVF